MAILPASAPPSNINLLPNHPAPCHEAAQLGLRMASTSCGRRPRSCPPRAARDPDGHRGLFPPALRPPSSAYTRPAERTAQGRQYLRAYCQSTTHVRGLPPPSDPPRSLFGNRAGPSWQSGNHRRLRSLRTGRYARLRSGGLRACVDRPPSLARHRLSLSCRARSATCALVWHEGATRCITTPEHASCGPGRGIVDCDAERVLVNSSVN
ncbi:hypothetical protein C8Q77DRAFT_597135 [Trametes polyzona]|nr:hypothetical protein C8Q77DRAFT_597135 [Trametes polyzona]